MKLYRKADGEIVGTQAQAGKGYTQIEVPTDKPGLIAWLNENLPDAPLAPDEIRLEGPVPDSYQSPLTARTVIAGIDAGMCSQAIAQFDGDNLVKVSTALIRRISDLAVKVPTTEDLLS